MRELIRRLGAAAFALLIVSTAVISGVAPSPVQPAAADWSEECSLTDSLVGAAWNTLIGADSGCRWESGTQTDYENMSATDGYASALGVKDSVDSYTTTTSNFQENTRTVAYSKAKIVLINELNNGSSVSVAKTRMNDAVEDYYARMQAEEIRDYNAKMVQLNYLKTETPTSIGWDTHESNGEYYTSSQSFTNHSYTLVNGSSISVRQYTIDTTAPDHGLLSADGEIWWYTADPDSGESTLVLDSNEYKSLIQDASSQATQVKDNLGPYADEVYNQYAAGEINSTNLAMNDPAVIAQEASTSLNSTGYYGHASIMLASIGAGGDVNVSHTVETSDGTSMNGTLFYTAQDAPESGWETNQTYNVSDYNGTFYFAVQKDDGTAGIVDLSNYGQEFSLTSATNTQTGESVNSTTVHRYTYDSTNASALAEEIDRLEELRAEYENQQTAAAGGSGPLSGFSTREILIGIGALAAVAYIYGREEDN